VFVVFTELVLVCTVCCGWQADIVKPIARMAENFQFIAESPFCKSIKIEKAGQIFMKYLKIPGTKTNPLKRIPRLVLS
jgi:hypothetical protein